MEDVNLADLLHRHESEAAALGKKIEIHCKPDLQLRVRRTALARLVANLVSNAFRHADSLTIRATTGVSRVTLTFDDDGPGIPADQREEVFKPFMRLDTARNQDTAGTGLGLSIARDIARNHGGDIHLHESPAGGLRAVVMLPL